MSNTAVKNENITAIIVDDEPGCIANLQYFLAAHCPAISIVATATNIKDALRLINDTSFDIAFLDIEIFDDNIFTLVERVQKTHFEIVFVTAYDKYAVKAFKVDALDYILKPLSRHDITHCYDKILKTFKRTTDYIEQSQASAMTAAGRKIILKKGGNVYIITLEDVYYLKAKGFYTEVHFYHPFSHAMMTAIVSRPISVLEKEYNDDRFFRIHKSFLVNTRKIANVVRTDNCMVKMEDDAIIPVAKRRINDFLSYINH